MDFEAPVYGLHGEIVRDGHAIVRPSDIVDLARLAPNPLGQTALNIMGQTIAEQCRPTLRNIDTIVPDEADVLRQALERVTRVVSLPEQRRPDIRNPYLFNLYQFTPAAQAEAIRPDRAPTDALPLIPNARALSEYYERRARQYQDIASLELDTPARSLQAETSPVERRLAAKQLRSLAEHERQQAKLLRGYIPRPADL